MYTACSDGSQQKTSAKLNCTLHGAEGNHILLGYYTASAPSIFTSFHPCFICIVFLLLAADSGDFATEIVAQLHDSKRASPPGGSDPAVETRPSRGPNDMNGSSKFPVPSICQELPKWKCSYEVLASSHAQGDVNVLSSVMLVRLN